MRCGLRDGQGVLNIFNNFCGCSGRVWGTLVFWDWGPGFGGAGFKVSGFGFKDVFPLGG